MKPIMMWSFGAMAFLLQYACRISTGGMLDPIMLDFSIGETMMSHIGSSFYYLYIAMQLFVGKITDKYPAHYVLIISTCIFLLANQCFSESITIFQAMAARAVMGAMGAFAFVVTMKLAMIWFENRYLGILAGLTQVSGMLGVVFGNYVVHIHLIDGNWRPVIQLFSSFLCVLLLVMMLLMRPKAQRTQTVDVNILDGLLMVWRNPQSWYNAMFAGLIYLPTAAFGEYWGIQYLSKTSEVLSRAEATTAVNMIFIGWALGGVLMGWYSDRIQKRRPILLVTPWICAGLLLPVLYCHNLSPLWANLLMFGYGCFNAGLVVSYAISGEINHPSVSGVSIAFCNMLSILLGSFALTIVGWLVEKHMRLGLSEALAYEKAVLALPIALILAYIASYCVEETHCKQIKA